MNYYSIFIFISLSLFGVQTKQFVKLNQDDLKIIKDKNIVTIVLPFEILDGYHIQAESDTKDNLIATEITFEKNERFEIIKQEFSKVYYETVVLNEFSHRVLSDRFEVTVTLKLNKVGPDFDHELIGGLFYQACDDRQCFFPRTVDFVVAL